jgi:hypothetical protein
MLNFNYGFQIVGRKIFDDIQKVYSENVRTDYVSGLLIELEKMEGLDRNEVNKWFPYDVDERLGETETIVRSLLVDFDKENLFLKEYFFHREVCSLYTKMWYLRPYFYLTDNNLLRLFNDPVFANVLELIESSVLPATEFLGLSAGYTYVLPKDIIRNPMVGNVDESMENFLNIISKLDDTNELILHVLS